MGEKINLLGQVLLSLVRALPAWCLPGLQLDEVAKAAEETRAAEEQDRRKSVAAGHAERFALMQAKSQAKTDQSRVQYEAEERARKDSMTEASLVKSRQLTELQRLEAEEAEMLKLLVSPFSLYYSILLLSPSRQLDELEVCFTCCLCLVSARWSLGGGRGGAAAAGARRKGQTHWRAPASSKCEHDITSRMAP
jgi:hypothetical protein